VSRRRISPQQAAQLGWTRVDARPWHKCSARWQHTSGWRLEHCGHPTANWPWALYDPAGRFIGSGAGGELRRIDFGGGWPVLADPMELVVEVVAGKVVLVEPPSEAA